MKNTILWLRNDLRLHDNPALCEAAQRGQVIPLYIYDEDRQNPWPMGGASKWWLHHSLTALAKELQKHNVPLILRRGDAQRILLELAEESGADMVCWTRSYAPYEMARDERITKALGQKNIAVKESQGFLLFAPEKIRTQQGGCFKVYTPFWKACLKQGNIAQPLPMPKIEPCDRSPASDRLEDWGLLPSQPDWSGGFAQWQPGEAGAQMRWEKFLNGPLENYSNGRDMPGIDNTSRLSPHLHFGEISPRQIWHSVEFHKMMRQSTIVSQHLDKFLAEMGWREFSYHLLYHFPQLPELAFREDFRDFPWSKDQSLLQAWQQGRTGYPMVDAGMRELWHSGTMHNRVRMIAASFLTKHLLIPWQEGAKWFWDCLLDADLANNSAGWQWVAGCGADAAPYFRIFNPVLQGQKFDPDGEYVRKWLPELRDVPKKYIHCPWQMERVPEGYMLPVVEHGFARDRALKAYGQIKKPFSTG